MDTENRRLFRALLCKQLREKSAFLRRSARTGKQRTQAGKLLFGALYAGIVLALMGSFLSLAWPMGELLFPLGQEALYFLTMELLALVLSVLAGAFSSYPSLFQAKDNDLLLALPIPPAMIFLVRLCGLYGLCLFYLLLVWVPAEVVYGLLAPHPLGGLLSAVPMALLLAGAASVLAALLGWGVALLAAKAGRHKTLVTVAASLGFLAIYYAGYVKLGDLLQTNLLASAGNGEVVPLSGVGALLGNAACGTVGALAVLAVVLTAVCAGLGKALSRPYLDLLTTQRGTAKASRVRSAGRRPVEAALLRRELLHLASSASYLLNCAMGTVGLLVLSGAAFVKADALRVLAARLPSPEWSVMFAAFLVAMAAGTNFLTAPSVSLEGESLWRIQSLPVTAWQVLRAKLNLHLLLTVPPALLCVGCVLGILNAPLGSAVLAGLFVVLFVVFSAALGLVLGLWMPSFHWTSEMAVIKQSPFCVLTLFGGWAAAFVLFVGVLALALLLPMGTALAAGTIFLAGLDAALLRWLKIKGTKKFESL